MAVLEQIGLKGVMILQLTFVGAVDMDSVKNLRHRQKYQDEVASVNLDDRARVEIGEIPIQKPRCVI